MIDNHHHHRIASVGRRVARPWWPRPRACLHRSAGVCWCRFGFGRSIYHVGDQADDSRRAGGDDRVRGWRETVMLYALGCCPAVWRCDQRRRCDDVGLRRWWKVDQRARIFPSCERSVWSAATRVKRERTKCTWCTNNRTDDGVTRRIIRVHWSLINATT